MQLDFHRVAIGYIAKTDRFVFSIRPVYNGIELAAVDRSTGTSTTRLFATVAEATAAAEEMARE